MTPDERLEVGLEHVHAQVVHPSMKRERMPAGSGASMADRTVAVIRCRPVVLYCGDPR